MSIAGGRNDTIVDNRFVNNNAWGVFLTPYPDNGPPCIGGTLTPVACIFDDWGNAVLNNQFSHNGSYGHPTNGDIAEQNAEGGHPTNCYAGNTEIGGGEATTSPSGLQQSQPTCDGSPMGSNPNPQLLTESLCDTQVQVVPGQPVVCPTGPYPRRMSTPMSSLPTNLATMPNPCAGVPADPWCSGQVIRMSGCSKAAATSAALSLSPSERFVSVMVRTGSGAWRTFRAHAGAASVPVKLGGRGRPVRVTFVERIKVGAHAETVRFTRIYRRC
jgi:hypothetical protein